jgi:hypothetical protein
MKTYRQLGTMPKVGDLITRKNGWGETEVLMVTEIDGHIYRTHPKKYSIYAPYLQRHYSPLKSETK